GAPCPGGKRAEPPASAKSGKTQTGKSRGPPAGGTRDRLEGAAPPLRPLSRARAQGKAQDRRHYRHCPRTCRLHLGGQSRTHNDRQCGSTLASTACKTELAARSSP